MYSYSSGINIGSLGCITSVLETYLRRLMVHKFWTVELLQQTAVLGSSYILITQILVIYS